MNTGTLTRPVGHPLPSDGRGAGGEGSSWKARSSQPWVEGLNPFGIGELELLFPLVLDAVVPEFLHLGSGRDFERAHDAEAEPLGVCVIPDALRQLRILLFPAALGVAARGAAQHREFVVIPMAA